jgi:aspartate-semialdehyde dehydrogenase
MVKDMPPGHWHTYTAHISAGKNAMKNVGFIGWRGMVGSVLMQRMVEERDFDAIRPVFFLLPSSGRRHRHSVEPRPARFRTLLIWMR